MTNMLLQLFMYKLKIDELMIKPIMCYQAVYWDCSLTRSSYAETFVVCGVIETGLSTNSIVKRSKRKIHRMVSCTVG